MLNVTLVAEPGAGAALILPVVEGVPSSYEAAAGATGFTGAPLTICDILGGQRRVLLAGAGKSRLDMRAAGATAASHVLTEPRVAVDLRELSAKQAASFLEGICQRAWRFDRLRTKPLDGAARLASVQAVSADAAFAKAWARRAAVAHGAWFARDLVTEPSNTLTPSGFIDRLRPLTEAGIELTVLRGQDLHDAGLTGLLAVGGGSAHPPALAILRWPGTIGTAPLVLVGKGITFDTGGISIKPADAMWEMRADMAGAAACAGTLLAVARRGSPAPVTAVLALAENTTSGSAYRPSDVLRHADGTTIEVVDTDAEGRLVLADALGWAVRQAPAAIVDLATLTGSVVTALGHEMAGLFSNDDGFAAHVAAAGARAGERLWRLPIDASHREALKSDIADLRHCVPARGQPDASQAAAFLRHFVGATPWAHLDIAGVESRAEADASHAAGATGFGVALLDRLVADRFEDPHRA